LLRERLEGGLSPDELAARAGLASSTVERIEAGGDATWSSLVSLVRAMGVSMEELAELHEEIIEEVESASELRSTNES